MLTGEVIHSPGQGEGTGSVSRQGRKKFRESNWVITALISSPRVRHAVNVHGTRSSQSLLSAPSLHGGRGATPSEGGRPSDLINLAGGGRWSSLPFSLAPSPRNVREAVVFLGLFCPARNLSSE